MSQRSDRHRSPSKSPARPTTSNGGGGGDAAAGLGAAASASSAGSPPSSSFLSSVQAGLLPAAAACSYAPCFCEENVWKLCEHLKRNGGPNQLTRVSVIKLR